MKGAEAADPRVLLLTFNGDAEPIRGFLDTRREVLNWFKILSNAILIVSRSDANALAELIHLQFPYIWFVITEVDTTKTNGWINQLVWDFINRPSSSGRWEPESKKEAQVDAAADVAKGLVPEGNPIPGKPGLVESPFSPGKYISVEGFPPGTEVKDPYTGKIFLVPKPRI